MNKDKQRLIKRLKIIEGQIRGLQEMIEKDKYCIDVITKHRNKAGTFGVEDFNGKPLGTCALHQMKAGNEKKAIGEILKVYRLRENRK